MNTPHSPTIHVYYGPDHELVEWLDHLPDGDYFLTYRGWSTKSGSSRVAGKRVRIPDGWVLDTRDGDEHIVGAWDLDVDEAVQRAQDYLGRMGYR